MVVPINKYRDGILKIRIVNADAISKEYLESNMDEKIRHLEMPSVLL
ncbi:MAG: hypothetical protein K8R31_01080 [Bacteroidales bacterium]|nr:hypothetical protein [Bacteroidales bacterium]